MNQNGLCDLPAICLQATGLRFFKICHSAEVNKIVDARTPVNPYTDRKVSLQWLHKNGHHTGIVNSSEGKCNIGIRYV